MRRLWYVPILHTTSECFIGDEMSRLSRRLRRQFEREDRRIIQAWEALTRRLEDMIADGQMVSRRLLVFGDSLPHPLWRFPRWMHKERHKRRSPMHDTVRWLRRSGARVRGTESVRLLGLYGRYAIACLRQPDAYQDTRLDRSLLAARDRWIALRIAAALPHGHDAILFMGAKHRVDSLLRALAPDIRIRYLRTILPRGYRRSRRP